MPVLKGAVLGFGKNGKNLTRNVMAEHTDARIVVACDINEEVLRKDNEEFGLEITTDPHAAVNRKDIDFVCVCSSNRAHKELVTAAAKAGKHVYCEKPIALELADADAMIQEVEKAGVLSIVNYGGRMNPVSDKIRDLVHGGELGQILSVCMIRGRGFGFFINGAKHNAVLYPENSGGWSIHHACHAYDFLYSLLGPVDRVYASFATTVPDQRCEELVAATIHHKSGAVAQVQDWVGQMRDFYTSIVGTKASLVMGGKGGDSVIRLRREGSQQEDQIPVPVIKRWGGFRTFVDCILNNKPSPCTLREARYSVAMALAISESARTGQPVPVTV